MEELKQQAEFYNISSVVKLEAKMKSLQIAQHLKEGVISMSEYSKGDLLWDAQEIYCWLLKDL